MWSRLCIAAVIAIVGFLPAAWAQGEEDPAPRFKASELLSAAVVKGPHHQVAPEVKTEGFFHAFAISSTFGSFQAIGRTQLTVRLQEIAALAALDEVSKTEVFLKSAGKSIVKVGQGAAAVVTDPVGTAKGVGAGVKRAGVNLGRRTQRAVASAGDDTPSEGGGNAAANAASGAMGVTGAMRQWARKVGVDPYTTNAVLRKALEDIGRVDAAGSLVTKIAVPVPAPVGAISSIGDVVWSKDPEEVRKINETSLRALSVPDDVAKRLFANRSYTLTSQTRFAAALSKVKAKGIADYVSTAAAAADAREALFFVESAEMLQQAHARTPIVALLTDSRALVVADAGGGARALLPLDWISSTPETRSAIREIAARARKELGSTRLEALVTGRVSDLGRKEFIKEGWIVTRSAAKP